MKLMNDETVKFILEYDILVTVSCVIIRNRQGGGGEGGGRGGGGHQTDDI